MIRVEVFTRYVSRIAPRGILIRYGVLVHPASQKIFDYLVEWGRDLDWRCLESNTQTSVIRVLELVYLQRGDPG